MTDVPHMLTEGEGGLSPLDTCLAGCWDLRLGDHPTLAPHLPMLAALPVLPLAEERAALNGVGLPVSPAWTGHHRVVDGGFLASAVVEGWTEGGEAGAPEHGTDSYPLAPVFVRDLCGRPVHTGLLPLPAAPSVPLFPTGCRHVPQGHAVFPLLENALFFTLRRVECLPEQPRAPKLASGLAGSNLTLRAATARPQEYPYKLRPDTFYADGWRLPQVPRVYAVPTPPATAQAAADAFLARWQARPAGQDYETFYDANNGDVWFEELFAQGCTVVPTLEAYNGRYHVDDAYVATAVDPGRAVAGLHEVVARKPSELPENTILTVLEPGYATATGIHAAKVEVSDGSGFTPPAAPAAPLPNLQFPHGRVGGGWGDVWLPTHPQHFAEPALYDWDANGRFVQKSGPLWDPLHYIYTSTPSLLNALRKPHPQAAVAPAAVFQLPPALKLRFHPLAPLTWVDAVNERTAQQRAADPTHPLCGSALDRVPLGATVAPAGYHPLPWQLEYELDPAHMPLQSPRHRLEECPPELQDRLMPVVDCAGDPNAYNVVLSEPMRQLLEQATQTPQSDLACDKNGTLLPQQMGAATVEGAGPPRALPAWLPHLPQSQLMVNVKRLFAARATRATVQRAAVVWAQPALPEALFRFREAALAWRRLRYRLFVKYPAVWQQAAREGLDIATAEALVAESQPAAHDAILHARTMLLGVVSFSGGGATQLPLQRAEGLRSASPQAKVNKHQQVSARATRKALKDKD